MIKFYNFVLTSNLFIFNNYVHRTAFLVKLILNLYFIINNLFY